MESNKQTVLNAETVAEKQMTAQAIVDKLASFGIQLEVKDIIVGASVTRYVFGVTSPKTRMSEIRQYVDDIKYSAQTDEDVMIYAPLAGQSAIGVDIVNKERRTVYLNDLLESPEYKNTAGELMFALGEEVDGKALVADLTKLPHMLIAGATGTGKSIFLNNLIISLAGRYSPEYVRFLMVDPKCNELSRYNGMPHMLTPTAINNVQDALEGMDYLIGEMERRFNLFCQCCVPHIRDYNNSVQSASDRLPYLVLVVDELADLMAVSKTAFEAKFLRLAQKSRAAGIHIVLATQRPDVKVVTGAIKANMPCRVALKVYSAFDSQSLLYGGGAEKLSGRGDMLFMDSNSSNLTRAQCAYLDYDNICMFIDSTKVKYVANFDQTVADAIFVSRADAQDDCAQKPVVDNKPTDDELYPYYKKALRFWLERNNAKASIASIQRNLVIGFNRAGRILENLQKMGYVEDYSYNPNEVTRPLKVLVTLDELDALFPDKD